MKTNILLLFLIYFSNNYYLTAQSRISVEYNSTFYGEVFSKGTSKENQALSNSTKGIEEKIKNLILL